MRHETIPERITVRVDEELADDLAILKEAGLTTTEAIRQAASLLADTYREAWDYGDVTRGVRPEILRPLYRGKYSYDAGQRSV